MYMYMYMYMVRRWVRQEGKDSRVFYYNKNKSRELPDYEFETECANFYTGMIRLCIKR